MNPVGGNEAAGAPFSKRLRRFVSANPWALAMAFVVVAGGGIGGAIIGLSPFLVAVLVLTVLVAAFALLLRQRGDGRGERVGPGVAFAHFGLVAVFVSVAIQAVPYGRDHTNPAVTGEPAWSSPRTRELMVNACYDCHSNEVEWPWYSNIAPISWAVTAHVDDGRDEVNYSEFATNRGEADETIEVILDGSMPPAYYTLFGLHPAADLSEAEITELVSGLRATPGMSDDDSDDEDDEERDEGDDD